MRINKKTNNSKKKKDEKQNEVKFKILETFYVINFNAEHLCIFNFLM